MHPFPDPDPHDAAPAGDWLVCPNPAAAHRCAEEAWVRQGDGARLVLLSAYEVAAEPARDRQGAWPFRLVWWWRLMARDGRRLDECPAAGGRDARPPLTWAAAVLARAQG